MTSVRNRGAPIRIGDILATTKAVAARAAGIAIDQEMWKDLVGDRVASRTRPSFLAKGTLCIETASAVWAQELSLLSPEIVRRLQLRGLDAHALRFKVTPSHPSRPPRAKAAPARQLAPLPARLTTQLSALDDPELAALIADTAARTIARNAHVKSKRTLISTPESAPSPRASGTGTSQQDRNVPGRSAKSQRTRGG